MTDLTLEDLQTALRPLHTGLAELGSRMDGLASEMAAMNSELSNLSVRFDGLASEMAVMKSEMTAVKSELSNLGVRVDGLASEMANVRIRVDGLPLLGVAVETLRQDVRMTRAAIRDMARVNITAGEVESMHIDIDRTMARQDAIETRLATLEHLAGQQQVKQ